MAELDVPVVTMTLVEYVDPSRKDKDRTIKHGYIFTKVNDTEAPWCQWVSSVHIRHFQKFAAVDPPVFKIHSTKTVEESRATGTADPFSLKRLQAVERKLEKLWNLAFAPAPEPTASPLSELSVKDGKEVIDNTEDVEQLKAWCTIEAEGENRTTLISALNDRIEELTPE